MERATLRPAVILLDRIGPARPKISRVNTDCVVGREREEWIG